MYGYKLSKCHQPHISGALVQLTSIVQLYDAVVIGLSVDAHDHVRYMYTFFSTTPS